MVEKKNKKKKIDVLKIVAIILLILAISLVFIKQHKQGQEYRDCEMKKELCNYALNESLKGWYQCIYNFGTLYFNLTDEEVQEKLNKGEDFYNLNNDGGN